MRNENEHSSLDKKVIVYKKFEREQFAENRLMVEEAKKQIDDTKRQIEESGKLLKNLKE